MKTIIAGSRSITDYWLVVDAVRVSDFNVTEVVCGEAAGVDKLGKEYANNHSIPCKSFPADWRKHGKAAGPIRNREMAEYADALIAVWDKQSKGTKNMIDTATELGLKVFVYEVV
jgi:hypothetical protein